MSAINTGLLAILNSLWMVAAATIVVWLAMRLIPRVNAATSCAVWWSVLAVVVALPAVIAWPSHSSEPLPEYLPERPASVVKAPPAIFGTVAPTPKVATVTLRLKSAAPPATPSFLRIHPVQMRSNAWPLWILALWSVVFAFHLGRILWSYRYLRGVKARSVDAEPDQLATFERWLTAGNIRRPVRLLVSNEIGSPMAVGFAVPAVILPEALAEQLDPVALDHVLLHELAHVARYDDWTNLAARSFTAVLQLHPIAAWILRRIEREREMACDDWVVAHSGAARPYAESLARLSEFCIALRMGLGMDEKRDLLASGLAFAGRASELRRRIERLLRQGAAIAPQTSRSRVAMFAIAMALIVLAGPRAPRWVALAQAPSTGAPLSSGPTSAPSVGVSGGVLGGIAEGAPVGAAERVSIGVPTQQEKTQEGSGVKLQPASRRPLSIQMNNDSLTVFETIGKLAGIEVRIVPGYHGQRIALNLANSTLEQALDEAARLANTSWKAIGPITIIIPNYDGPLATPQQLDPAVGAEMHNYPRRIDFEWSKAPGAETYTLEVDCMDCCESGKWCSDVDPQRVAIYRDLLATHYSMEFYGDQRGRWRVSAAAGFLESDKSPWREFSFKTGGQVSPPHAPVQSIPRPNAAGDLPLTNLRLDWMPVAGTESYVVEIDSFGSCAPQQWCSEVGQSVVVEGIKDTKLERELPSADQVRWRVWATSGTRQTLKSGWQVLRLTGPGKLIYQDLSAGNGDSRDRNAAQPNQSGTPFGTVYKVGNGVLPPFPTYRFDPMYPEQASLDHVTGTVLIQVIVAEDGTVRDAHVVKGVRSDLDQAALEAVKAWLFKPGMKDGQPVAVWSQIEVTFKQK